MSALSVDDSDLVNVHVCSLCLPIAIACRYLTWSTATKVLIEISALCRWCQTWSIATQVSICSLSMNDEVAMVKILTSHSPQCRSYPRGSPLIRMQPVIRRKSYCRRRCLIIWSANDPVWVQLSLMHTYNNCNLQIDVFFLIQCK